MKTKRYTVRLTDEQVEAVKTASRLAGDDGEVFSGQLRNHIAGSLALYGVEWPETPAHGGKRPGAGRKSEASG